VWIIGAPMNPEAPAGPALPLVAAVSGRAMTAGLASPFATSASRFVK